MDTMLPTAEIWVKKKGNKNKKKQKNFTKGEKKKNPTR
jgi:hypothetical protein